MAKVKSYLPNLVCAWLTLQESVDYQLPSHNEPWLLSTYLGKMAAAFQEIKRGEKEYTETDGAKEYQFEGFSVLVK